MHATIPFAELLAGQMRQRCYERIEDAIRARGYEPVQVVNTLSSWRATARRPGGRHTTIVWESDSPRSVIQAILDMPRAQP